MWPVSETSGHANHILFGDANVHQALGMRSAQLLVVVEPERSASTATTSIPCSTNSTSGLTVGGAGWRFFSLQPLFSLLVRGEFGESLLGLLGVRRLAMSSQPGLP